MRGGKSLATFAALMLALTLGACSSHVSDDARGWYATNNGEAPKHHRIYICHGFGCTYRTPISYSAADLAKLKSILASGKSSPEAERQAIARAVQWQEKRVAPEVGSAGDVGGYDLSKSRVPGQMDCIDEAANTTSLLVLATERGYLHHHKAGRPVSKGFLIDGSYPHASAVVKEIATGQAFAVDSWPRSNGMKPDIMPLGDWYSKNS